MSKKLLALASFCLASIISTSVNATEIYPVKNSWYSFDVDALISQSGDVEWIDAQEDESLGYVGDGSALTFSFSLTRAAILNVVDAGLAGDVFTLLINGQHHTGSSVAANSGAYAGFDFDAAWAAAEFSKLSILLAPGSYSVTGFLNQSAVDEYGSPYLASVGGLQIVDVAESNIFVLFGLGLALLILRRRSGVNANTFFDKGALS